jgi:hypothetical protein
MLDVITGRKIEIRNAGWYRQDVVFNGRRRVGFIIWRMTTDNKCYCLTLHPDTGIGCSGVRIEWLTKTDYEWRLSQENESEPGEAGIDTTKCLSTENVSDESNTSENLNVR